MKGKSQEEKKKRFLLYLTNLKELKKKTKDVLLTPKMQGHSRSLGLAGQPVPQSRPSVVPPGNDTDSTSSLS